MTILLACLGVFALAEENSSWPPMFRDFGHGVTLELRAKSFQADTHKLGWCGNGDARHVCTIDGAPFLGTDWDLPSSQLESAVFRHGSHVVRLDVSGMFNPWTKNNNSRLSILKTTDGYKVKGEFSDGAGGYYAEWLVIGDTSIRTVLSSMEEDDPADAADEQGAER